MASRTIPRVTLISALAAPACSSSEKTPEQPTSAMGGGIAGTTPPLPAAGGAPPSTTGGSETAQTGGGTSGGAASATGGNATSTGGAATTTGGNPTSTGGAATTTGGNPTSTGGASTTTGGMATSTGGTAASTGGAAVTTGGTSAGPFVLAWQDDFDALDASAWQLQTFTWEGNEAQFSTENASISNGVLTLALTAAPSGSEKPYLGVELRSTKTLTFGKVSTRMRFAKGSGVVSSIVLFYTPFPNCDWNEIDIEHLGKTSNSSQLNAMVFTGTPNPGCTTSVAPTQDPQVVDLGFNAETDFHTYDIEWTPSGVKYFADGALLRTWTANISLLKLPSNILLTIWASGAPDWAGALTPESAPTGAEVDWVKVYDYDPSAAP